MLKFNMSIIQISSALLLTVIHSHATDDTIEAPYKRQKTSEVNYINITGYTQASDSDSYEYTETSDSDSDSDDYDLTNEQIINEIDINSDFIELVGSKNMTDEIFEYIKKNTNIKTLQLYLMDCDDKRIKAISEISSLEKIIFKCCEFFDNDQLDESFKSIAKMGSIKHISINEPTSFTDHLVAALQSETIEHIQLTYCGKITAASLAHLTKFPNLQYLNLNSSDIISFGAYNFIGNFPKLTTIEFSHVHNKPQLINTIREANPYCEIIFS